MLLIEWFAWWAEKAAIEADELLSAFHLHQMGDPGWTMDRQSVLSDWKAIAQYARVVGPNGVDSSNPYAPGKLQRQGRMLRAWMREHFGAGIQ